MGARTKATINPALLVWARESLGLRTATVAAKLKVPTEKLESWEEGRANPSIAQLRRLAAVYKRPIAVFYLPKPPKRFQALHDFRRLADRLLGAESQQLALEIRKAHERREVALDLYSALGETPPGFAEAASISGDFEEAGEHVRSLLGVTQRIQWDWKSEYQAFNTWRARIENLGVLVFQAVGVEVSEMRGFSLALNPLPVVVVNIKDTPRAKIFTLLHEFGHLLLREDGICDLSEAARQRTHDRDIEVYANMTAGAALVPRALLVNEEVVAAKPSRADWPEQDIASIANRYWVSREVVLRRLLLAGRVTRAFYRAKRDQYQREFQSRPKSRGGFAPPHAVAVSRAGNLFVSLVLSNYAREKITSSDFSHLLGIRLKHLPKIEEAVLRHALAA